MKLVSVPIGKIKPYENNPRYNDAAIDAVKESIEQCTDISPIILDENYVILAGHTRFSALYELDYDEVDCVVVEGLTEEQKRKYRILDNKTAEYAEWEHELLVAELEGLDFGNLTLFEKELEKAADKMVKEHETGDADDEEEELVICPRCGRPVNRDVDVPDEEESW